MSSAFAPVEHIAWQVQDPVAQAAWYVAHLGFRVLRGSQQGAAAHFLADSSGRVVIEIYRHPDLPEPDYAKGHPLALHLAVTAAGNPELFLGSLIGAGATLVTDFPAAKSGDRLAMVRDPWGFPLQLVSRHMALGAQRVLCIGNEALAAAFRHPRLDVGGYFDVNGKATASEEYPLFESLDAAISHGGYDLALLSVPNFTKNNLEIEEAVLEAGLPLAITKMRLRDWSEIERIVEKSRSASIPVFCNDHYHLSPTFQTARAHIEALGQLLAVDYDFALPYRKEGFSPWVRSYEHVVLEDVCYHHFAVVHFLCASEIETGWCVSRATTDEQDIKNRCQVLAAMRDGWTFSYNGSWGGLGPDFTSWPGEIRIEGEKGTLRVSQEQLIVNGQAVAPENLLPRADWIHDVTDALAGETRPPGSLLTLDRFLPVTRMIHLCLKQLERPGHS